MIYRNALGITVALVSSVTLVAAVRSPATAHDSRRPVSARFSKTVWDSVYTEEQAARGQKLFSAACARCHGASLGGVDAAPALAGGSFLGNWDTQTLDVLHDRVRTTMPPDSPNPLNRQEVSDVVTHILRANGFPAGKSELPQENDALANIKLVAKRP